jgi:hypothetical protein
MINGGIRTVGNDGFVTCDDGCLNSNIQPIIKVLPIAIAIGLKYLFM